MLATPHVLVEGAIIAAYAIRASHAFIYVRGEVLPVLRRLQNAVAEAYAAGYLGRDIKARASTWTWWCTPARAPTSAARRPRCSTRWRAGAASPGCGRPSPPWPGSTPARRWSTTSSPSPASRRHPQRRRLVPVDGHGEVAWLHAVFAVRARHPPRPVRGAAGHHVARIARLRRRGTRRPPAQVLDPRRVVDAAADRRTPRRATGLRGHGCGRLDAGHQGAADLRRDHLRGARGSALDPVLRTRVVRQVHARAARAPTGWARSTSAWKPARAPKRISTSCWTSPTPSSESRSARWAMAPPAR